MIGYREGVVKAWQDVQLMDQHKIATIDANQDHVVCPKDMVNPEECLGYNIYRNILMKQWTNSSRLENDDQINYLHNISSNINCSNWSTILNRLVYYVVK